MLLARRGGSRQKYTGLDLDRVLRNEETESTRAIGLSPHAGLAQQCSFSRKSLHLEGREQLVYCVLEWHAC